MGTDGEQTFTLACSGHTDGVPDGDQGQTGSFPVHEIPVQVHTEEAMTLMSIGDPPVGNSVGNCMQRWLRLRNLPIVTFVWNFMSFIISYSIAVAKDHVEPDFPYISHTAVEVPERGIFSQMVNLGAVMLAANMYVKYLQVKAVTLVSTSDCCSDNCINSSSLVVGIISALGLTVVANFQTREMREVHYSGAFLAFVFGMIYCWMQTSLSIRHRRRSKITCFQIMNSILLTVFLFIFGISKIVYKNRESAGHGTKHDTLRDVYLVSTTSEWLTAIFTISYVLTYIRDFSNIRFNFPSVEIRNERTGDQNHHSTSGQNGGVNVCGSTEI